MQFRYQHTLSHCKNCFIFIRLVYIYRFVSIYYSQVTQQSNCCFYRDPWSPVYGGSRATSIDIVTLQYLVIPVTTDKYSRSLLPRQLEYFEPVEGRIVTQTELLFYFTTLRRDCNLFRSSKIFEISKNFNVAFTEPLFAVSRKIQIDDPSISSIF